MWTLFYILFVVVCGTASESKLCEFQKSVELTNHTYAGLTFGSNETFVDLKTQQQRGCVCLKGTCARKCCPFGQAYNISSYRCNNITHEFNPPVTEQRNTEFKVKAGFNATKEFIFMTGIIACDKDAGEERIAVTPVSRNFNLITNGNLYVDVPSSNPPNIIIYGPDKYCVDMFVGNNEKPHLDSIVCYIQKLVKNHHALSSTCMLVSCFFILLTVAVYAGFPELHNLPGKVLIAYLICLFVAFLLLATVQILAQRDNITQDICFVLTFIIYFFLLAAFFWLNVMCYDIWWTFSGKRSYTFGSVPQWQHKRFVYYTMYAFGVPTALTVTLCALEFSGLPRHPLLPKIRQQGCFLYGNTKLLYLYGPIVILCVANMTFFGLTAFKIWKTKNETMMLRGSESCRHDQDRKETQRFTVYVKLFAVMGISWILEVVSSLFPDAEYYWRYTDAYNVLIGLIIFIIFVCKKKTWEMIKTRFGFVSNKTQSTALPRISLNCQ